MKSLKFWIPLLNLLFSSSLIYFPNLFTLCSLVSWSRWCRVNCIKKIQPGIRNVVFPLHELQRIGHASKTIWSVLVCMTFYKPSPPLFISVYSSYRSSSWLYLDSNAYMVFASTNPPIFCTILYWQYLNLVSPGLLIPSVFLS